METCRRPAFSRRCRQQASVRTTTTTTTTAPAAPYSRPTSTLPQPGPPTRSRFRQDHSRLLQVQSSCPSSCLGPGVEAFPDHSWAVLVLVLQKWSCLHHCLRHFPDFDKTTSRCFNTFQMFRDDRGQRTKQQASSSSPASRPNAKKKMSFAMFTNKLHTPPGGRLGKLSKVQIRTCFLF